MRNSAFNFHYRKDIIRHMVVCVYVRERKGKRTAGPGGPMSPRSPFGPGSP